MLESLHRYSSMNEHISDKLLVIEEVSLRTIVSSALSLHPCKTPRVWEGWNIMLPWTPALFFLPTGWNPNQSSSAPLLTDAFLQERSQDKVVNRTAGGPALPPAAVTPFPGQLHQRDCVDDAYLITDHHSGCLFKWWHDCTNVLNEGPLLWWAKQELQWAGQWVVRERRSTGLSHWDFVVKSHVPLHGCGTLMLYRLTMLDTLQAEAANHYGDVCSRHVKKTQTAKLCKVDLGVPSGGKGWLHPFRYLKFIYSQKTVNEWSGCVSRAPNSQAVFKLWQWVWEEDSPASVTEQGVLAVGGRCIWSCYRLHPKYGCCI